MSISVLDLFKIGVGPSSSHTVGPMRAAHDFVVELQRRGLLDQVRRIEARLYGSLSATGVGHGTDRAVVAGLMGARPDEVDPDFLVGAVDAVRIDGELPLAGTTTVPFDWARDLRLLPVSLPYHPNAMRIAAHGEAGVLYENTYYSVGGGFVVDEAQAQSGAAAEAEVAVPYPFDTGAELLAQCRRHGLRISELMLANESAWRSEAETRTALLRIWEVMRACVTRGVGHEGVLPGGLNVRRRAPALYRKLSEQASGRNMISDSMTALDWVNLYALAVNEENAGGGRVVTAPTNGAAGIIPAVMHYYMKFMPGSDERDVENFLLAAAAVGALCKKNASISGAEVGCQGEV
ncbi:MAG: L-serine ammonia-lyase, partial [Thauera sp.]|nr:L-serine ammonia-lyase [Thauera sp.]